MTETATSAATGPMRAPRTVADWLDTPALADIAAASREGQYPFGIVAGVLDASGIAAADLVRVRAATSLPDVDMDRSAYMAVLRYASGAPGLTLRAAMGWLLLSQGAIITGADRFFEWERDAPNLLDVGWLLDAAGVGPREALALASGDGFDEPALLALAALRGASLPATT
jgi:hypothetical protein